MEGALDAIAAFQGKSVKDAALTLDNKAMRTLPMIKRMLLLAVPDLYNGNALSA